MCIASVLSESFVIIQVDISAPTENEAPTPKLIFGTNRKQQSFIGLQNLFGRSYFAHIYYFDEFLSEPIAVRLHKNHINDTWRQKTTSN